MKNELLTVDLAQEIYGVILDPESFEIDEVRTRSLRERMGST
jgi:hypothetical protein